MGLFAIGNMALGMSFGDEVKVLNEAPGPHSMIAWNPGAGSTACGIVVAGCVVSRRKEAKERRERSEYAGTEAVACRKSHPAEMCKA